MISYLIYMFLYVYVCNVQCHERVQTQNIKKLIKYHYITKQVNIKFSLKYWKILLYPS